MISRASAGFCRVLGFVVAGVLVTLVSCSAASFYAETQSTQGKKVSKGAIYVRDNMVRQEGKSEGLERITIVRCDLNLTWQLYPSKKEYREVRAARLYSPDPEQLKEISDAKELGKEKIAGYMCTKTLYSPREQGGARITVWMSEVLNWPLKVQIVLPGNNTVVSEFKKIKLMTPGKELFEVPPGYKLVTPK